MCESVSAALIESPKVSNDLYTYKRNFVEQTYDDQRNVGGMKTNNRICVHFCTCFVATLYSLKIGTHATKNLLAQQVCHRVTVSLGAFGAPTPKFATWR